jgi:hypothetical protein
MQSLPVRQPTAMKPVCLSGSYNISDENFVGSLAGPAVDTKGANPGPDWTEVISPPESMPPCAWGIYPWPIRLRH